MTYVRYCPCCGTYENTKYHQTECEMGKLQKRLEKSRFECKVTFSVEPLVLKHSLVISETLDELYNKLSEVKTISGVNVSFGPIVEVAIVSETCVDELRLRRSHVL